MTQLNEEWLAFLREQYPTGSRIRLTETHHPSNPLRPGSEGTLTHIDEAGSFHVDWDGGSRLALVIGQDRFSVLPPQTRELKLYMPLTAELYERDQWGDMEDEPIELNGEDLREYEDQITAALLRERLSEEQERGIMRWYDEGDAVEKKVRSAVFAVEDRDRQLWGVAVCRVAGELTPEELDTLKDYISGQASDGWGEGFEQREIAVGDGAELYVHLWSFDRSWSIQTEEERFGQPRQRGGMTLG